MDGVGLVLGARLHGIHLLVLSSCPHQVPIDQTFRLRVEHPFLVTLSSLLLLLLSWTGAPIPEHCRAASTLINGLVKTVP